MLTYADTTQLLVAYLCLPLVSEMHSLMMHVCNIYKLAKRGPPSLLNAAHWTSLALFRVVVRTYADVC